MGSILMQALQKRDVVRMEDVCATVQHEERATNLSSKYGIKVTTDNRAAVLDADVILLCIKPQTLGEVVNEIASELRPDHLIVSIAASVPTAYIEKRISAGIPVIRAMPNTPSMVGAGADLSVGTRSTGAGAWSWAKAAPLSKSVTIARLR